jgi:hypothetical protein
MARPLQSVQVGVRADCAYPALWDACDTIGGVRGVQLAPRGRALWD